jgi:hypothetical protein
MGKTTTDRSRARRGRELERLRETFLMVAIFRPLVINRILGIDPPGMLLKSRLVYALSLLPSKQREHLATRPWFAYRRLAKTNFGGYRFLSRFYRKLKKFVNAK